MNISPMSSSMQSFKRLLVSEDGMGETAKWLTRNIEQQLSYDSRIDMLEEKGIDVLVFSDSRNAEDRVKVALVNPENQLYKHEGKDHVKSEKSYDIGHKTIHYGTNLEKISEFMDQVLAGKAPTAKRAKITLGEIIKNFSVRANNIFPY